MLEGINSFLDWSFKSCELIVVADGSTDDTREVVKTVKDKRIRYFYKDNGGVASARNFGKAKACGDYIAFLDSDDLWPPNYLSVMIAALEEAEDYGLAYSTVTQIFPDGEKTESYRIKDCASGWITRELFNKSFIFVQATVFRRSILENFYWDESLKTSSDSDGFLRLSQKTKILFVRGIEPLRRVRQDSLSSHAFSTNISCNKIKVLERFYQMNGEKYFSKREASLRISHACREAAKRYCYLGARRASICLYKRALSYNPFSFKGYKGLIEALMRSKSCDKMSELSMQQLEFTVEE